MAASNKLALELAADDPDSDVIARALASKSAPLVTQAAKIVASHSLTALAPALRAAYRELSSARLDPGSLAKEAVLEALDQLEDSDVEVFVDATVYVQPERLRGKSTDGGARARARGILGLARLGHADFLVLAGACLGDRDPSVRLAAARAIAHRGERAGAGLLQLRLAVGDDTREVWLECVRGLFALAPEIATRFAERALEDDATREDVLQALGTTAHDGAIALLVAALDKQPLSAEREAIIAVLGLSLRPIARARLLELVESEHSGDAEAALGALAIHRYDERLVAEVRERTGRSRPLAQRFRELFER